MKLYLLFMVGKIGRDRIGGPEFDADEERVFDGVYSTREKAAAGVGSFGSFGRGAMHYEIQECDLDSGTDGRVVEVIDESGSARHGEDDDL